MIVLTLMENRLSCKFPLTVLPACQDTIYLNIRPFAFFASSRALFLTRLLDVKEKPVLLTSSWAPVNMSIIVNLFEKGKFWLIWGRLIFNLEWRSLTWQLIVLIPVHLHFSYCIFHCIISCSAIFDCCSLFHCIIFFSVIFEYLGVGPGNLSGRIW